MSALSDQQNYDLEDSNGQRWTVTLANINNVLALDKGWHKFFTDHDTRKGYTLIFNYIIGSHFVVQIYGKTGCQRTGSKTKEKFLAETGECHMNFNDLRNKQGSGILNENPLSEVAGCEPPVEVSFFEKDVTVDTDSPHNDAIASAGGEVRSKRPIPELPGINIKLPALSVEENSMDNADSSTSKTHSLDIDLLHAEQPNNAKSKVCPGGHLGPKWSSRWIKRLKLSSASSSFSIGTKSKNLCKTTSHDKVNKFLSRKFISHAYIRPTIR